MNTTAPHSAPHDLFLDSLETGTKRAAYQTDKGEWTVDQTVKQGILAAFKAGHLTQMTGAPFFVDKHNLMPQTFTPAQGCRIVPGGTAVRRGAHVGQGVIMMPPSYINIGAYVDEGTMVDSHVLVGSCAQIGKRVHLSAGVQIGGVLEPIAATPVIIEDDVFVGAGTVIVDGLHVQQGAVLAPGLILSKSVDVFDVVKGEKRERGSAIPMNAVVIPGTCPLEAPYAKTHGLQKNCALIVKYKDAQTKAAVALEEGLRE